MPDSQLTDSTKPFLEYLEREMTIQGILSTFCVVLAAGALDRVLAAEKGKASDFITSIQTSGFPCFTSGIAALILSAWLFYCQRSDLAWLNGQFGLAIAREIGGLTVPKDSFSVRELIDRADSWDIWLHYRWGLTALTVAAADFVLVFVFAILRPSPSPVGWFWAVGPLLVGAAVMFRQFVDVRKRDEARGHSKRLRSHTASPGGPARA